MGDRRRQQHHKHHSECRVHTPTGSETAITTPFTPAREFDPVRGSVSGEVLKFDFQDTTADDYDVGEVGLFDADGVMLFIGSRPAADGYLFSKAADAFSGFTFEYTLATADMPTIDFAGSGFAVVLADAATNGLVRRVADDTPTTNAERYVTPAYMQDAIDAIPSASGDASGITHVEASRVQQVSNEIRLTPTPAVTALTNGDAFRFRVEAASNSGVTVKVNALSASQLRRRGGVQVGANDPQLAVGDLVTVVWVSPRFWLVGINPGTAALYDVGTSSGDIPVLGSGGDLAAGSIPNLPASRITSGRFSSSRMPSPLAADTVDGKSLWTGTEAEYDAISNPNANTIYVQTP